MKIMFVCHGNICRSPMAEMVLKKILRENGFEGKVEVVSRATSDEEIGNPIYPPARAVLESHGIPYERREATKIKSSDYFEYDMIIGMDSANIRNMKRIFGGDPEGKIMRLMETLGKDADVSDPWYTGRFEDTYRDVTAGCTSLFEIIKKKIK